MLEDNGIDPERRLCDALEKWRSGDKRAQFYRDGLCDFFQRMHKMYDRTIFDQDRIDRLSIRNEDFIPVLESFYVDSETGIKYRFDAIRTDVLGHAYENYLSYKATGGRKAIEKELFKRKQGGIYYTPEFLVDFIVQTTLGERLKPCKRAAEALRLKVLDPACGSGTFLVRALEEFRAWHAGRDGRGEGGMPVEEFLDAVLRNCIYGVDKDPARCSSPASTCSCARRASLSSFLA